MAATTTYFEGAEGCSFGPVNISHSHTGTPAHRLGLNPIAGASHTRNRKLSPPNSACFQGTREGVIREIIAWALSSLSDEARHILWVFGYAGCGKSAIAQAVAVQLEGLRRLGASFFFFRGAGDRSRIMKFAETIASQIATSIDGTARHIQAALAAQPDLLEPTTSPVVQFNHLVLNPVRFAAGKWYRPNGIWRPVIVVIDGFDECEDKDEASNVVQDIAEFFSRKPGVPLRFIIMSRVEDHLHKKLHGSGQVCLLNLVDRTSDEDISTALNAAILAEEGSRALASHTGDWLSPEDKEKLVKHIGGSFIFMTTMVKFLFAPFIEDGLTPRDRLPLALNMNPGFDGLYKAILERHQSLRHLGEIISIIALARRPLSAVEIAEFLGAEVVAVVSVLIELHAIIQVPGDDHTPITLWHSSLHNFLNDHDRSGQFFASPSRHVQFTSKCIDLAFGATRQHDTPQGAAYSRKHVWEHFEAVLDTSVGSGGGGFRDIMPRVQARDAFLAEMPPRIAEKVFRPILSSLGSQSLNVLKNLSLMQAPASAVEIADLLDFHVSDVVAAAKNAIGVDDLSDTDPISFPPPLHSFATEAGLPGTLFVSSEEHERLTLRCIARAFSMCDRPSSPYALRTVWSHYRAAAAARASVARQHFSLRIFVRTENKDALLASAPIDIRNDIYWSMISCCADLPHFLGVLRSGGGSNNSLSIAGIGGIFKPELDPTANALQNLQKIFDVHKDNQYPIIHQYPSFSDFISAQHTAPKPHPRVWQCQLHLGPPDTRDTDVVIPVFGGGGLRGNGRENSGSRDMNTSQFINALLGSIGQGPAVEVECPLGSRTNQIQPSVINGPKWGYDLLVGRRTVLVDCHVFDGGVEDDLEAATRLHDWWKDSYPQGKVCGGVVYVASARCGFPSARVIQEHIKLLVKVCGVPSSAITFVVRQVPLFDSETFGEDAVLEFWRRFLRVHGDIDGVGMRVMHLDPGPLEAKSAWDIFNSILTVANERLTGGSASGGKNEAEDSGHSACDLWLTSEKLKLGQDKALHPLGEGQDRVGRREA